MRTKVNTRARVRAALCFIGACLVSLAASAHSSEPLFKFAESPGPYPVGLRVVEQYDYSRVYRHSTDDFGKPSQGERARPLQTLVWYPSKAGGIKPMTVGDYAELLASDTNFVEPKLTPGAIEIRSGLKPSLGVALWASRDVTPRAGRFPLIIYAPGASQASWEDADLCEFLASYGYVVLASPSLGERSRSMTTDVDGINAQAHDISFLIGYARMLADVDESHIAVIGSSWGGIANLFAAARDDRITALIDLDGSIRYFPGLVRQAGDVHPELMTIPLLYFAQGEWSLEQQEYWSTPSQRDGPNVLNAWTHGDLVVVHMLGLTHGEFGSMSQRSEDDWKEDFPRWQKADYGREDGIAGYAWVARYTLHFVDAYLKQDSAGLEFLKRTPAEQGAPTHFIAASFRAARGIAPSFAAFRAEVGRQGLDHSAQILAAIRTEHPSFALDRGEINDWATALLEANHPREAISLLMLNIPEAPVPHAGTYDYEASVTYERLGDAYRQSGRGQLAVESYKRALDELSINASAKKKLDELEGHRSK